jgi:hypothetical protein
MPYVHTREPSEHHQKNVYSMGKVRTDSKATTLDKFLNPNSIRKSDSTVSNKSENLTVIPVNLLSVKKLIYEFETD